VAEASRSFGAPKLLTQIKDERVNESSGIAPSHRDGSYYTHNDSGDKPRFFRFNREGKILGVYDVSNAKAFDWEDMASAKYGDRLYLYFGDIGDNRGARKNIVVYRVPEPSGGSKSVTADRTYTLTYPDGAHNAEALLVHPETGDLTIITKTAKKPSQVFWLKNPKRSGSFRVTEIGSIEVGGGFDQAKLITGGAYSPDGKHVVLRTYLGAYEFAVSENGDWTKSDPSSIRTAFELGGEGISYSRDGRFLVTSCEGSPCGVNEIKIGE
jgi:hypothetical protein